MTKAQAFKKKDELNGPDYPVRPLHWVVVEVRQDGKKDYQVQNLKTKEVVK